MLKETEITRTILDSYHKRMSDRVESDVIIVGAGPAGMVAAYYLSKDGFSVTIMEKRLALGGGIWGGGMAMPDAVVQDDALPILDDMGITYREGRPGLYAVDSIELACGLGVKSIQAGTQIFNLSDVEDLVVRNGRVGGVVVNRTLVHSQVPCDPITFESKVVIDGTGHEAICIESLRKRGMLSGRDGDRLLVEMPMDAEAGEEFVVNNVAEVYPGLWVSGMSVCAVLGGARMGPIFGGMLMSGKRVAGLIAAQLR